MANIVILTGRFTAEPEVKAAGEKSVCNFTIAVDRDAKNQKQTADFIRCTAWGGTAAAIGNYLHKGSNVNVVGKLQSREYTGKDGTKRTVLEVICDRVECLESKNKAQNAYQQAPIQAQQQYQQAPASAPAQQYAHPQQYPQQPAYQQAPQSGYMDFSGGYTNYQ